MNLQKFIGRKRFDKLAAKLAQIFAVKEKPKSFVDNQFFGFAVNSGHSRKFAAMAVAVGVL